MNVLAQKIVWSGYHSQEVQEKILTAWEKENLLCLFSPAKKELFQKITPFLPKLETLPEKPIFAISSTGTEGEKIIFYSKKNILSSLAGIFHLFDLKKIEIVFSYPQPYHVFGLILGYLFPHIYQKKLIFSEGSYQENTHQKWLTSLAPATLTLGTPTHFKDLIQYLQRKKLSAPVPSYSCIIGGAAVTKSLWFSVRRELKILFPSIGYGATELSPGVTHLPPGLEPKEDGEIGSPLAHIDLKIKQEQEAGISVQGPNVCLAIIERDQFFLPKEIHLEDTLYQRKEDGIFVFQQRKNRILNRGGEKFSLEEIEKKISQKLPLEVIAVPIPHPRLGEELALLFLASKHFSIQREEISHFLKQEMGRSFNSQFFFAISDLPINLNAKTDHKICQEIAERLAADVSH